MEAIRVKLLEKHQKKVDTVINDLQLLLDAQHHIMVNTGEDVDVCAEITASIRNLQKASYNMLMAIASAEGGEITGQMRADLDSLTAAARDQAG